MSLSHGRGSTCFLVLLVPGLLLVSGCGRKSTGTITGKVYYGDTLLRGGHVTFRTADGKAANTSPIEKDGSYKITMPAGEVQIAVETESMNRKSQTRENKPPPGVQSPYQGGTGMSPEEARERYTWIPFRFSDPTASGQTYTVKPGSQDYDIKLPPEEGGAENPQ